MDNRRHGCSCNWHTDSGRCNGDDVFSGFGSIDVGAVGLHHDRIGCRHFRYSFAGTVGVTRCNRTQTGGCGDQLDHDGCRYRCGSRCCRRVSRPIQRGASGNYCQFSGARRLLPCDARAQGPGRQQRASDHVETGRSRTQFSRRFERNLAG